MIALSTAFDKTLIAIDINGVVDYSTLSSDCKQSENVLNEIDKILDKNNLKISDNDSYAVVLGPGSFTGLRIGASLIKGLCAGSKNKCRVVGLSSLSLLAYEYIKQSSPKHDFLAVINALSGLCFVSQFNSSGKQIGEEKLVTVQDIKDSKLKKIGLKGEKLCKDEVTLTAQGLLEMAKDQFDKQNFINPQTFSPTYLRRSQAEVSLELKEKKKI